ncbi:helix-turn-helix domain-containing protein [Streptomyces antimycoticus]|uniref:helix-turn-helix domain-containing protein n=1 Tax=Streptomyces antimycoticus TaxID=68175 RepID=UPI0036B340E2
MPARHFDGGRLRRVRRAADLNQAEVAKAVDVSRAMVSKWESNVASPEAERLPALAAAVMRPLDELFPREDEPDLADLRHDAGLTQRKAAHFIGASPLPISNAERGVRRLDEAYVAPLAQAYRVSEAALLAAQDRSFGIVAPARPASRPPTPQTLSEKVRYLLDQTYPHSTPPSDAELASRVNATAGENLLGEKDMRDLRMGTRNASEVLDGRPESLLHEGLSEVFGVSPKFFLPEEAIVREVVEGINLILLTGAEGLSMAARGDEGLSTYTRQRVIELVRDLRQGHLPDSQGPGSL